MHHYVLIDGNNIAFQSQLAAMDKKTRAKRLYCGELETTAINGVLHAVRQLQVRYPKARLLTLWDSGKAWRYGIYPEYKGNRKENPTLVEAKEAIQPQRDHIYKLCDLAGIPQVTAENFEADDIAAFLADMMSNAGHEVTLVTRDQDWLQMVRPGVTWYDRFADRTVTYVTFEAATGFATPAEFSEAKILQGDAGDNVTGIKGVGAIAAENLIAEFDTADNFIEQWDEWVAEGNLIVGHPLRRAQKPIATFLADKDAAKAKIALNRKLMDLRIMYGNPELKAAFRKTNAVVDKDALKSHLASLAFVSIASKLDEWIAPFAK